MAHAFYHAKSSARRFGGKPEDYRACGGGMAKTLKITVVQDVSQSSDRMIELLKEMWREISANTGMQEPTFEVEEVDEAERYRALFRQIYGEFNLDLGNEAALPQAESSQEKIADDP